MIWRWPSTMIAVVVNEDPFGTWLQTYLQRQEYVHQRGQLAFELLHGNFLSPLICGVAPVSDVTMM